jgi:BolA protein
MLYNNKIVFMNINELIAIVKNKLEKKIIIQDLKIEDKSFLHKNHEGHQEGKFHLKLTIKSDELAKFNKIVSTKRVYSVLSVELKEHIHSIQILLN